MRKVFEILEHLQNCHFTREVVPAECLLKPILLPKITLHCLTYIPYTVNIYKTIIFTREVVSAEGLLQPILLPKIYPALFDLYALQCEHLQNYHFY